MIQLLFVSIVFATATYKSCRPTLPVEIDPCPTDKFEELFNNSLKNIQKYKKIKFDEELNDDQMFKRMYFHIWFTEIAGIKRDSYEAQVAERQMYERMQFNKNLSQKEKKMRDDFEAKLAKNEDKLRKRFNAWLKSTVSEKTEEFEKNFLKDIEMERNKFECQIAMKQEEIRQQYEKELLKKQNEMLKEFLKKWSQEELAEREAFDKYINNKIANERRRYKKAADAAEAEKRQKLERYLKRQEIEGKKCFERTQNKNGVCNRYIKTVMNDEESDEDFMAERTQTEAEDRIEKMMKQLERETAEKQEDACQKPWDVMTTSFMKETQNLTPSEISDVTESESEQPMQSGRPQWMNTEDEASGDEKCW